MIKRFIVAIESIADSLKIMADSMQEMRAEQKEIMNLSKQEMMKGPERVMEIFTAAKSMLEGGKDGN
jgi:hypothetical protein